MLLELLEVLVLLSKLFLQLQKLSIQVSIEVLCTENMQEQRAFSFSR